MGKGRTWVNVAFTPVEGERVSLGEVEAVSADGREFDPFDEETSGGRDMEIRVQTPNSHDLADLLPGTMGTFEAVCRNFPEDRPPKAIHVVVAPARVEGSRPGELILRSRSTDASTSPISYADYVAKELDALARIGTPEEQRETLAALMQALGEDWGSERGTNP